MFSEALLGLQLGRITFDQRTICLNGYKLLTNVDISATTLNDHMARKLSPLLGPQEIQAISDSLDAIIHLPSNQQHAVRIAFAEGFNRQNIVLTVLSAAALFSCFGLWERRPRKTEKSNP